MIPDKGSGKDKKPIRGSRGAPLGMPPPLGREGVTLAKPVKSYDPVVWRVFLRGQVISQYPVA